MKPKIKILIILLGLIMSFVIFAKQASAQQANVSFQEFYDQLSPYGQWVDHPDFGYIWIPDVEQGFVPYSTGGYWVLSNYGWTWVSDYDWGWAPFHYGRWDYDSYYGWFWVPDNEWGPSWVIWRQAPGYYGWSPMRPGMSINLSFGSRYNSIRDYWMFVRDRDIERHNINRYCINRNEYDMLVRRSWVINRTYFDGRRNSTYIAGPSRDDIQRVLGRMISLFTIMDYNRPGQYFDNGRLQLYRPQVRKYNDRDNNNGYGRGRDNGIKPAPAHVVNRENMRRHSDSPPDVRRNPTAPPQRVQRDQPQTDQPQRVQRDQPLRDQPQRVTPPSQRDQPQRVTPQNKRDTPPSDVRRDNVPDQPQRVQRDQPQRETPPATPQRRVEPTPQRVEPPQRREEPTRQRVDPPQRKEEPTRQRVDPPQRKAEPVQQKTEPAKRKAEPPQPQRTRSEKEKKTEQESRSR